MSNVATISQIKGKYLRLRWTESILFALGAAALAAAASVAFGFNYLVVAALSIIAGSLILFSRYRSLDLNNVDDLKVSLYLNRIYPALKESSDLLLKPEDSLTSLEKIQLNRIDTELAKVAPEVELPNRVSQSAIAVVAGTILLIGAILLAPYLHSSGTLSSGIDEASSRDAEQATPLDPSIKSAKVTIAPPSYTRLSSTTSDQLTFTAVEGSDITWNISFHQAVDRFKIVLTTGDSIVAKPGAEVSIKYKVTASVLYRIQWSLAGQTHSSDYHRIDMKPDVIPQVAIKDLPQFTRLKFGEKNDIAITSDISDDYGLTQAYVIATVSKGSGESVKFREEKLPFVSPATIGGTKLTGRRTLDFRKLGMEPGDEVYFYVEAYDNKQPSPQRNRTDTYFIALADTTQQEIVADEGLGVDLMPEYFRSQRQIIIDTEKLLAKQKTISKHEFNSTSNELGFDQKVLRLKYGQFLGEEFETNIGPVDNHGEEEAGEKSAEDIVKQYGHQHDTENEHNQVADKKVEKEPEHHHDVDENKDDPMAAFRHDHDSEEEATFFTMSVKAKLRAALTLMWESELKLRMYQPKESLPTQYQILKLLKEISNDSRVYVHRMGFDPPPVKEEKRLTGDLNDINPAKVQGNTSAAETYPAIRNALTMISSLLVKEVIVLTEADRQILHNAGDELAALALKSPGNHLDQLSTLKELAEGKVETAAIRSSLENIQETFWSVLPAQAPAPTQKNGGGHPLELKMLDQLKVKAND